jgi:predicted RNase H-like nuclease (RuvC/YqgF family)
MSDGGSGAVHLIVGIDPGKTAGIACLDLSGNIVRLSHASNPGLDWFVSEISASGTPSIITADKQKGTETAYKIGAYFNARVFRPDRDIALGEKRDIARRAVIKDRHERDACTAAMKAFKHFKNKLAQAEHIAKDKGIGNVDSIKAKVLERYSIDEAINNKKANRR